MKSVRLVMALLLATPSLWSQKNDEGRPAFELFDKGSERIIDYEQYGTFSNIGTEQYRYYIKNREGLAKAAGEGVYPNVKGLLKDPDYQKAKYNSELEGSVWDYVNTDDLRLNFFKWASNQDQPAGLKQFYIGQILERAGLREQAVKAYHAAVVHFPKAIGSTFWKTPWYVATSAMDRISYLTRRYPELGMKLVGGKIRIQNRFDNSAHNDVFLIDPGKIVDVKPGKSSAPEMIDLTKEPVRRQIGKGRVRLNQYANGHWRLIVNGKPFLVRAVAYQASQTGKSPDNGSLVVHRDWMIDDINKNGKVDGPYDSWVDKNLNNKQDSNEPVVGDFKLLQDMGANSLRLYHHGHNKALLNEMYQKYGISVVMGDYLGAYAVGSGASWYEGTDYSNPEHQKKMLESVRAMVEEYKDEPYVLFWVLGNENNYGVANNSGQNPTAYYQFVNKAANLIKSLDPERPVAICNGDTLFLDIFVKNCPDVDIYGANAYRGDHGFGDSFWRDIADLWGKPVFITEYGCPAYHHRRSREESETLQANYLRENWLDIEYNAGGSPGVGNAIGGALFEWMDEWWKAGPPPQYDPKIQDIVGQFGGPFPDGWSYEEWFGLISQGDGKSSPLMRQLRKSYFLYKDELWNAKAEAKRGMTW